MITRQAWSVDFLSACGLPVTTPNIQSLVAWIASENSNALFNPLDTTEQWEGSTDFNAAGVQNYTSYSNGIAATKATLYNGFYAPIIQALSESQPPAVTCSLVENSVWGSKPNSTLVSIVIDDWPKYANLIIPGTQTESEATNVTGQNPYEGPPGDAPAAVPDQNQIKDATGSELQAPIVAGWPTPSGSGYTAVAADGGVFCEGDAVFHGSMAGHPLNAPIVDGWAVKSGYVLLAQDGGTFVFSNGQVVGQQAI